MNIQQFLHYSKNSENINISDMQNLEAVIDSFSYFQAARALYLKGLFNADSYKYNFELKKTAALTTERDVLFDFITSKKFSKQNENKNILDINVNDFEIIRAIPVVEETFMIQENMEELQVSNSTIENSTPENSRLNSWSSVFDDFEIEESKLTNFSEKMREIDSILHPNKLKETNNLEHKNKEQEDVTSIFYGEEIDENELRKFDETRKFFENILNNPSIEKSDKINEVSTNSLIFEISDETFKEQVSVSSFELENKEEAPFTINFEPIYEKLEIGKPIPFVATEKHSFFEWLKIAEIKPIVREEKKEKLTVQETKLDENSNLDLKKNIEKSKKNAIIDQFLEANPKISPAQKSDIVTPKIIETPDRTHLMTETLAKVYLEQKKYDKAIQAFQILILKNPEKSVYFADRIKDIKILQQNNI
jgi:tetratricopeptide (TPR) repeat protein